MWPSQHQQGIKDKGVELWASGVSKKNIHYPNKAVYLNSWPHTHHTDNAWVSRGDTLSVFERRGDLIVVIGVRLTVQKSRARPSARPSEADLGTLFLVKLTEIFGQSATTSPLRRRPRASGNFRAAGAWPSTMLLIFLRRAPTPELGIAIAEWLCALGRPRLSRTARAREAACAWPTRKRRARTRLSRTARAREFARTSAPGQGLRGTVTVH